MNGTDQGHALLSLARHAIERALTLRGEDHAVAQSAEAAWSGSDLSDQGASFVTLTQNGQLRGCIGTLEAWRPLKEDVQANAVAAALQDPRFPPLRAQEWPTVRLEVSVLSALERMEFQSEEDALSQLRPGLDGIVLGLDGHRSTFLPQVWEQLPDPSSFVAQLKRKAGLPMHFWSTRVSLHRFTVSKWKEPA